MNSTRIVYSIPLATFVAAMCCFVMTVFLAWNLIASLTVPHNLLFSGEIAQQFHRLAAMRTLSIRVRVEISPLLNILVSSINLL